MALLKIDLPFKIKKPILAVGADMKNSLCFAFHKSAFISEVISDLQILDNFKKFKKRVTSLPRRFKLFPQIIAYDKHPEYFSTKYILNSPKTKNLKLIPVQHHHAHIAACMLENKLDHQQVIGVAFDGTGLGDDSTLWGGEFLIADYRGFQRSAHLQYIPLLGGQQAIMQPWRVALAWLYLTFGNNFFDLDLDFLKRINKRNWDILRKMWKRNFNTPLVSSMGRLFDAVGSLLLGIYQVKFEAEAAINLEKAAASYKVQPQGYGFKIKKSGQAFVIDPIPALKQIVTDLKHKHTKAGIAAGFHLTVAQMIRVSCREIRNHTKINTVALTGGVFQNKILLKFSLDLLAREGFRVLTHKILPCSDGSVSLGQAVIAARVN